MPWSIFPPIKTTFGRHYAHCTQLATRKISRTCSVMQRVWPECPNVCSVRPNLPYRPYAAGPSSQRLPCTSGPRIAVHSNMKLFVATVGVALLTMAPMTVNSFGQNAKDEIKEAGRSTGHAAKKTGEAAEDTAKDTGHAAKKAGRKVKKGTKKATNK